MNIKTKISSSPLGPVLYWTVALAIAAGFILSILSWTNICSTACSAAHKYRLFGMPFEWIGAGFFIMAGVLHYLSLNSPILSTYLGWMMAGALGSEVIFLGIQKYVIGGWCPICVSIASVIALILLTYGFVYIRKLLTLNKTNQKDLFMRQLSKSLTPLAFFTVGMLLAFIGVAKPVDAADNQTAMVSRLEMGNKDSDTKIYFITDWFCPACKKAEPAVAKIYSATKDKVGFFFVDLAVHANTANYTPYNVAFMANDKSKYIAVRHALDELSYRENSPTDEQMEAIAKKIGVPFHEMSFREVKTAMKFFDDVANKYDINRTPTMVIENTRTKKKAILNGTREITLENVQKTIESLAK